MFALLTRVFAGYKDALITVYNQYENKVKILQLFTSLFVYVIVAIAFVVIPLGTMYYLKLKIDNFELSWVYLSLLFIVMNVVAYFSYLFLVQKSYKIISIYDILKSILVVVIILLFYNVLEFLPTYKMLIYATIVANFILLFYLIINRKKGLRDFKFSEIVTIKVPEFSDNTKSKFITLTFMASGSYFIYGLLLFAPVFVMLHFQQIDELANFQVVARSIYFALVAIFSWPLGRFLFPELSSLIEKKEFRLISKLKRDFIKLLFLFSPILIVGCWVSSKYIITMLFPASYIDSYMMLNILIVAIPFIMYTNFSTSIIKAVGLYKTVIMIDIFAIIVYILSFLILKFIFYIEFSSLYAFVVSMIFIFIVSYYYEQKIISLKSQI
jgi:O-antigen/teichoic acid export membrane protein